jgi:hypothetical protein
MHAMNTATKSKSPLADDLLNSGPEIAAYIGIPLYKFYYINARGLIPTIREGDTIKARKSELDQHYRGKMRSKGGAAA